MDTTYSLTITGAEKLTVQADNSTVLSVAFDIVKDGEVVASYAHGFPLDTPKEDILASLEATRANYAATAAVWAKNEANDAANAVADATIEALVGQEITNPSE